MKKKAKITLLSVGIVLLVAVVTSAIVFGWYAPYYWLDKTQYDIHTKPEQDEITVMSFNVRCVSPQDLFRQSWFYRAQLAVRVIEDVQPDVIGFQEVNPAHEKYLSTHLKGYDFYVVYRNNSSAKEGVMIAYRNDRFLLQQRGMFWLSDTPEVMSKDWGSYCERVAAYVTLKDGRTGKEWSVMDTHLDHISPEARDNGMRVIVQQKEALGLDTLLLMGDMNDYDDSLMYQRATQAGLQDAQAVAADCYTGPGPTWHNYGKRLEGRRIDYFFVTPDVNVHRYAVWDKTYQDVYPSDHFPIVTRIGL